MMNPGVVGPAVLQDEKTQGRGCRGCCSFPHGPYVLLPQILSIIAIILSNNVLWGQGGCHFVEIKHVDCSSYSYYGSGCYESDIGVGFLRHEDNSAFYDYSGDDCVGWSQSDKDEFFDAAWRAGKAFSIMSTVIGFAAVITMCCAACVAFNRIGIIIISVLFLVCSFLDFLTLVALSSKMCDADTFAQEEDCSFGAGAGLAIGAGILWIGACVTGMFTKDYHDTLGRGCCGSGPVATTVVPPATQMVTTTTAQKVDQPTMAAMGPQVSVTETYAADGSKIIETTTLHPDGSRTIETAIEHPPGLNPMEATAVDPLAQSAKV